MPSTLMKQHSYEMNNSKMATDLLSAGIRSFEKDGDTLKDMIKARIIELSQVEPKVADKV